MNVAELAEQLAAWIKDRVIDGKCEGVVLGMSGGIDSSVLAVLCKRAFPESVLGLLMPCYSDPQDEEHALAVARQFSIATKKVCLDSVFDSLLKVLPDESVDMAASRLAKANIKVRLRMLTLYYFANLLGYMVVGSSNRSELAIGYFTKYGDGAVDILPIGGLVKRQVVELARFLKVPQEIINKPPSAGLWQGQTDEGDLGFTYDQLDRYLISGEAAEEVREKIEPKMASADHKRIPLPLPGFKLDFTI